MPGQCLVVTPPGWSLGGEAQMNAGDNYNRPMVAKFLESWDHQPPADAEH